MKPDGTMTELPPIGSTEHARGPMRRSSRCSDALVRSLHLVAVLMVAIGCCSPAEAQLGRILRGIGRAADNARTPRVNAPSFTPSRAPVPPAPRSAPASDHDAANTPWLSPLAPVAPVAPVIPNPPVISKVASGSSGVARTPSLFAPVLLGILLIGTVVITLTFTWYSWRKEQRRRCEMDESMQSRGAMV